jgi:hypothetical protein
MPESHFDDDDDDCDSREDDADLFGSAPAPADELGSAVVPAAASTNSVTFRDDDPAFNALLQCIHRVEEAVALSGRALVDSGTRQVHQIAAPLTEFELTIKDHSRCPTTERRFVPGGHARATECTKTLNGSFPHIIREVPEAEGGGTMYHVITSRNVMIVANVRHIESGDTNVKLVLQRANELLRTELEAKGEYPLTELRMKMRLVAAHVSHNDPGADPVGIGPDRWWDKDLNTEIDGQRDKPQLLIPSEVSGAYTQAVLNGGVTYSFKMRPGVTSPSCRAHRRCQFKFVVEPESTVLRTSCPNLTALTKPFWSEAKYNSGRPPKVSEIQTWLESEIEGGAPVKYDRGRKRPHDDPAS